MSKFNDNGGNKLPFDYFSPRIDFSWLEVMELLKEFPELEKINKDVTAKKVAEVDKRFDINEEKNELS